MKQHNIHLTAGVTGLRDLEAVGEKRQKNFKDIGQIANRKLTSPKLTFGAGHSRTSTSEQS